MERTVKGDFDWVTALPVYQHLITILHTSLGELLLNYFLYYTLKCKSLYSHSGGFPFEVFYGHNSHSETNPLVGKEDLNDSEEMMVCLYIAMIGFLHVLQEDEEYAVGPILKSGVRNISCTRYP